MYNQKSACKIKVKTLDLTLSPGNSEANKEIHLDPGEEIAVAAKPTAINNEVINLGFYEGGQIVNDPIHVDFYRDRDIGNHPMDGFMPLNSLGNTTIEVRLSSVNGNVTAPITVQVVFLIKQPFIECRS